VIWQESRFNARAVSPKGAAGIAQFMPQTASWHGLADPFDPTEALRHSARYLRELRDQFGNLGLAAASGSPWRSMPIHGGSIWTGDGTAARWSRVA
jgi:soluble lytic murein transglycosylase-like protein